MVSAGREFDATGLSSNPTIDRSPGTASPRSRAAASTPAANRSEKHSTPVISGSASSSIVSAAYPSISGRYGIFGCFTTTGVTPALARAPSQPRIRCRAM